MPMHTVSTSGYYGHFPGCFLCHIIPVSGVSIILDESVSGVSIISDILRTNYFLRNRNPMSFSFLTI